MSSKITTKPHIIIEIAPGVNDIRVTNATLYRNILPPVKLSNRKATQVVKQFNEEIYEVLGNNRYLVKDKRFIAKFANNKVKRINKYIGPVIATALTVTIVASAYEKLPSDYDKKDIIEIEASESIETTIENTRPTIIDQIQDEEIIEPSESLPTISFSYPDRTSEETYQYTVNNYINSIRKYAEIYGEDPNLITAIVSQENPFNTPNETEYGARGVTQIESIWWNEQVTAYRFDSKDNETITIDGNRLNNDPDYAIKVGCMIFNFNYQDIYHNYVETKILTPQEGILATVFAYNKGLYGIKNLINTYGIDYINHVNELKGGDNEYLNHIYSYIPDGTQITLTNKDGTISNVYIDNINTDTFTK